MLATPLAATLARRDVHYGWVVVGVTFFAMLVNAGAMGAAGVFIVPLEREFGWSAAQISSALALRFALFGLVGPFAAAFMNQFGVRRMMIIAITIVVSGLALSLFMREVWQLVALWGVVVGIGTGLTAMVLAATVATRWFSAKRGLVVGLLSASSATGQLVFLPALAGVTEAHGWRFALALVCAALVVVLVVVALLMRNRPADLGLAPYGGTMQATPARAATFGALLRQPITVLADAARTRAFWILFATFFICGASTNGLVQTHFISMCGDFGLAAVTAASVLAMMGIFDFFGTVGSGWLSDRVDNRWLLFWYYGLRGLSLVALPFGSFTFYGLSPFAVFYGLDWIATVPPTVKLTADRFGAERAPIVFGWIFAGHQLGAASAAWGGGFSRTFFATYSPAFFVAGVLCLLAAAMVLGLARPRARGATAAA